MAETPRWVQDLVHDVMDIMSPDDVMGNLGYNYSEPDNSEEPHVLEVYPTPSEMEGGKHDGYVFVAGFDLCVSCLAMMFDILPEIVWQHPTDWGDADFDGPNVTFEGMIKERHVILSVFTDPPADYAPTVMVNDKTGDVRELRPKNVS